MTLEEICQAFREEGMQVELLVNEETCNRRVVDEYGQILANMAGLYVTPITFSSLKPCTLWHGAVQLEDVTPQHVFNLALYWKKQDSIYRGSTGEEDD